MGFPDDPSPPRAGARTSPARPVSAWDRGRAPTRSPTGSRRWTTQICGSRKSALGGVEPVRAPSLEGAAAYPSARHARPRARSSPASSKSGAPPPRERRAPRVAAPVQSLASELDFRPRRRRVIARGAASSIASVNAASAAESPSWPRVIPARRGSPPAWFAGREQRQHGRGGWPPPLHPLASTRQSRPQPAHDLRASRGRRQPDRRGRAPCGSDAPARGGSRRSRPRLCPLLEPGAETLVQLRPCVLRRPGVGNVADQDVMEAVRVVVAATQRAPGRGGPVPLAASRGPRSPPAG